MEQATNQFTKGLQLDTHPMVQSNDTLTDCLNGTLITMNGNEVILQNDMGNRRVDKAFLPPGYEPVGMKEYGGIIYVASYNPITNKSQIGSFPSPQKKLSSNTNGEAQNFNFQSFTSGSNIETDENLELTVLKSDSFMLPLTRDLTLRAGDKFAVYSEGLSGMYEYITNYNNVDNRFPNKAYTPKNRKYTLQLGVLNSQNEFVDITKTLCRWKNDNGTWKPVNYDSDVSEAYKFNDGYFISDSFTNTFNENTIADSRLIKERQKIAANTYSYKLVGPLYLKVTMNHIENFNYNIYGLYNGSTATLWIEGYLTYNCPDGIVTTIGNSNENYATFDEGTPSTDFGFDLIGKTYDNIEIGESVYNPSNNTYTVKIVKKYNNITSNADDGVTFNYVLGVKASIDDSNIYLRGLSVKGSIDLSLLGSGNLKFNGWRFHNNFEKETTLLSFAFNAYPEYGKSFTDLRFKFKELYTKSEYFYPAQNQEGLPVYNGKQTISFGWSEIGLQPRKTYMVYATYRIQDDRAGTQGAAINIIEDSHVIRWFLTTELFNNFYFGSGGVQDFCNVLQDEDGYQDFMNTMIVDFTNVSNLRNQSREKQEMNGSLISARKAEISYQCDHTLSVNISTNPTLEIIDENKYPDYVFIAPDKKHRVQINSVTLESIGDKQDNLQPEGLVGYLYNYSSYLRDQLFTVSGKNLQTIQGVNPAQNLQTAKLLESSVRPTSTNIVGGEIRYYDVFKARGDTIDHIHNAFQKFSTILTQADVLPSSGYYGGVIVNFDDITGGQDGHFLDVAVNQGSDKGDLPGDDRLKTNWYRVHEVHSDITESGKYNDANWSISDYLGSIFQIFNDSVKDSDKTFLYYFCEGNKYNPSANSRYGYSGKNGAAFTRAWWKMPNGEWACFNSLYKRTTSFADFIKSQLGNKDLIYCMYDDYEQNSFIYAPKENYIYYDRYNIPIVYSISYSLQSGQSPHSIVTTGSSCGNLQFSVRNNPEFSADTVEFTLESSEKFYDNINSVDSENISNVYIGTDGYGGLMEDSMGRPLNPSYVYHLEDGKLHRIDRTDFYVDSANKTRVGGANRLLYNINRRTSVEDKCQVTDGNDEDSYTRLTYNLLNVVVPV